MDGCSAKVDVLGEYLHWRRYPSPAAWRSKEVWRYWQDFQKGKLYYNVVHCYLCICYDYEHAHNMYWSTINNSLLAADAVLWCPADYGGDIKEPSCSWCLPCWQQASGPRDDQHWAGKVPKITEWLSWLQKKCLPTFLLHLWWRVALHPGKPWVHLCPRTHD